MKKIIILIISLFCLVYPSYAQFTTVSATITDFDNVAWSNAQWKVQFVPNPNQPNPCLYNVNGVGLCTSTYSNYTSQNNTTDGSGALSGATDLYGNIKIVVPQNYATPSVENFVLCVRFCWN